jgi:hypothetical protein
MSPLPTAEQLAVVLTSREGEGRVLESSGSAADPDWVREAFAQVRGGTRRYLRDFVAVLRAPVSFVSEWASGKRRALNPLTFLSTSIAVSTVATYLQAQSIGLELKPTWWANLAHTLLPYVASLSLVALIHPFLRWLKGQAKLRTALGAMFFLGGSLGVLTDFASTSMYAALGLQMSADPRSWAALFERNPVTLAVGYLIVLGLTGTMYVVAIRSLAALYRLRIYKVAIVYTVINLFVGPPLAGLMVSLMKSDTLLRAYQTAAPTKR